MSLYLADKTMQYSGGGKYTVGRHGGVYGFWIQEIIMSRNHFALIRSYTKIPNLNFLFTALCQRDEKDANLIKQSENLIYLIYNWIFPLIDWYPPGCIK